MMRLVEQTSGARSPLIIVILQLLSQVCDKHDEKHS